jgi:4-hydroxy-3-polyprenylbenzoate decarboxylase
MRLVVGISGASGAIYGIRLLEQLKKRNIETHLVVSRWGWKTIELETDHEVASVKKLAGTCHDEGDLAASISSGTFPTDGMIIAPCSMKTLAGIACGYSDSLLTRAADVTIKQRRRLVLMVRETPLSTIHLENMLKLSRTGVIIMPPVPAFYARHDTTDDIVDHSVGKVLDLFGIPYDRYQRWGEEDNTDRGAR